MKKLVIDNASCKGCGLCIGQCTKSALTWSTERYATGNNVPVLNPDLCIKCGLCEGICPDFALWLSGD